MENELPENIHPAFSVSTPQLPAPVEFQEDETERIFKNEVFGKPPPVIARFYVGATKDAGASEREGVPVYVDSVRVMLQVTGERDYISVPADDEHKHKYPKEWALFQRLSKRRMIPLEALPKMTPAVKAALNELGMKCVQDMAASELPGYLAKWKTWAQWLVALHENGEKPRVKLQS